MAHSKSAKKSIRLIGEARTRNRSTNSALKTQVAKAERLIVAKDAEPAKDAVKQAAIALDKAAQKGVIHSNNAARRKSRLTRKLNTAFPEA